MDKRNDYDVIEGAPVVPLDEERQRRRRGGSSRSKKASGREGVKWPDVTEHGGPKKTCANARAAIEALAVSCRYDEFHDCVTITRAPAGDALDYLSCANIDHAGHLLRVAMHETLGFDPGNDHVHHALIQLALTHRFDPLRDYLDGLRWDGTRRLDTWLAAYLSAEDTPLNQACGRLTLVAAVRRVRNPGCKFDHILVLEGPEGTQKSGTIALLALDPRNFSDQTILGLSDRQQQELLRGKWLYEIAEMHGMKRTEVEHVKAFASRTHDRARPAYGRSLVDQPRRCIFIGTTNSDTYLKSQTGNRRFWPVKTDVIDIEALRRDRDQLWGEAAAVEKSGLSLMLPPELWEQAKIEQDARLEHDPWMDILDRQVSRRRRRRGIPHRHRRDLCRAVKNPGGQAQYRRCGTAYWCDASAGLERPRPEVLQRRPPSARLLALCVIWICYLVRIQCPVCPIRVTN